MIRNKKVVLQVRTATVKSRVEKLEVVGHMKTRVNSSTETEDLVSQIAHHLFVAAKNLFVHDCRAGMQPERTIAGKLYYKAADAGPDAESDSEDDDPNAWPGSLPTFSIASVINEAKRISEAARSSPAGHVLMFNQLQ